MQLSEIIPSNVVSTIFIFSVYNTRPQRQEIQGTADTRPKGVLLLAEYRPDWSQACFVLGEAIQSFVPCHGGFAPKSPTCQVSIALCVPNQPPRATIARAGGPIISYGIGS